MKNDPELSAIAVILVASIYDKSKYKRQPDNLYGAEDYIERHQLQDELIQKIKKYLVRREEKGSGHATPSAKTKPPMGSVRSSQVSQDVSRDRPAPASVGSTHEIDVGRESVEWGLEKDQPALSRPGPVPTKEPQSSKETAAPESSAEHESAKRLARIIIADIALYNKKEVEEGVQNGTFLDLLREQLAEGRRHYDSRVSKEIREVRDYFGDAIEDFIQKKKREVI